MKSLISSQGMKGFVVREQHSLKPCSDVWFEQIYRREIRRKPWIIWMEWIRVPAVENSSAIALNSGESTAESRIQTIQVVLQFISQKSLFAH